MIDTNFEKAFEVVDKARKQGIILFLENEKIKFKVPRSETISSDLLAEIKTYREQIRVMLVNNELYAQRNNIGERITSNRPDGITSIPLSYSQERLWFIDRMGSSINYHISAALKLEGSLDKVALEYALRTIVNRHEILRTVIVEEDGKASQHVMDKDRWELSIVSYPDNESISPAFIKSLIDLPFDLAHDHMLRAHLVVKGPKEHLLVMVMHHIASDGWSVGITVKELAELYAAYTEGRTSHLPAMDIQYADYAIWQRKYISGDISDKQLAYWKEKMEGVATLQLPLDFVRPAVQSTHGASYNISISRELTAALKVLSLQQDVTLYMTLLAAFNVLLYHYSGQEDICVGSPTAGRTMQEVETLIGFFVNTLALRNNLSGNPSFTALLQNVKQTMMGAYDHQDLPFEKVVETVVKERDISRSPLFQVAFSLQNMPDAPELRLGDLQMVQVDTSDTTAKFDLTFFLQESNDGIAGKIEYSVDLFGEPTIARMAQHFEQLLRAIVSAPETKIGFLSILSDAERNQLLKDFNDTAVDYPADKSITELFVLQVARTPAATAVTFGDGQLTYAELDVQAGRLAVYLQQQGVTSGTLVPVCMNRSLDMMVGILAILKAGGAYVPVDPGYPRERIAYMLEDINCSLALTTTAYQALFEDAAPHAALIYMDQLPELPTGSLQVTTHAESLAYVIYTSGSTGKPKGVVVTHRNVTSLVKGTNYITLTPADRILSAGSLAFDAVTFEYWGMLLNGGTLILSAENSLLDPALLKKELHGRQVTKLFITTSWFNQLVDTDITVFEKLSAILTGGEKLSEKHLERFRQTYPDIDISNIYGPTENTTFSLSYLISKHGLTANTPIGTPLNNRTAYVLSTTRSLVPVGVAGELYVGGDGVAQGYLNQPVLTAERFIPHPFSNIPGDRLYKTGDIVRWTPDGFIEYLGRVDEQVKIRGFRVELGEIESTLLQSELVANAVVVALSDNTGQHSHKRLVAYIIPNGVFNREGIIIFLKQKLPEYMIPAVLVEMDKFPVTTNGKIDKKVLPDPGAANREDTVYAAPRSATEEGLAGIWQELLGVSRISIYDNFFELGGDSIITIQVVSRAKRAGFDLQPRDLFLHQTIASLAALLSSRNTTTTTGEQGILTGNSGLLPIQQWYFETGASGNAHFNQSVLMSVSKQTDNLVLAAAVKQLSVYHDALRFTYEVTADGIMQVYSTHESELETVDLQHLDAADLATFLPAQADKFHRQMDIRAGILFRPVLFLTPATETHNRLLLVVHHLAVDGVSWRILLQDLELILKESQSGKSATAILGPKTTSYRQWYDGLVAYSHRNRLLHQQSYWEQIVQRYTPLPAAKSYNGIVTVADTGYVVVTLDSLRTQQLLRDVPRVYHTEINDVLLCALAATLSAWTNRPDVLIGLEGHGREDIIPGTDTSRSVGWFTSMYPVLLQVAAGKQPGSLLKDVKEQLRRVPDKGIGFGVLKYISKIPALQGKDAWDIIFNYLGQTDHVVRESGDLSVAPEASGAGLGDDFPVREKISVNSIIQDGELVLKWGYSTLHFDAADISTLADNYLTQLESLISHCMEQATLPAVYTPADYNLGAEITNEELDAFLDSDYKGASLRGQISGLYRLTGLQEGMLFHSLFDTQGGTYVEQFSCELSGVQEDLFRHSWDHLLQLHSILRSGFYHETFSIPVQCVYQTVQMPLTVYDYRAMDESTQAQAVKDFEKTDGHHGFDLKVAPLMRISLLHLKGDTYRMVWTFHHILFDGWSLPVMVEALLDTYERLVTGKPLAIAGEDRYEDYIRYQERMDKELEEQYWRRYLAGLSEGSLLPFIGTTDKLTKGGGNFRETTFRLDSVVTENLTRFAQQNHITQNTLMQGVWAYLLYRYSGHRDVVYGTTVSGRPEDLPGVEKRVGLYINTLPLYTVIDPAQEITVWLQLLQNGQQQSREHQYVGLNEIQRWTNISGELFDSTITFQNYPVSEVVNAQTWQLQVSEVETHPHTNYPLTIIIGISDDTRLIFTYNNDLLSDYFIEMIARHFQQVITQLISNQAVYIRDIEPLGAIEQQQLENRTAVDVTGYYFLEMFERQAKENPTAVALVFEEEKLSYRALNKRASQLAGYLQERGVTTGSLVPLCMERGPDIIIGMLGILKAGGAYVPIEPDFPAERIKYMLEDTAAAVVVSSSSCRDLLPATGLTVVSLDDDRDEINRSTAAASLPVTPEQLLYVIYTSGSTGTPKGVMVTHHNMADYMAGLQAHLPLQQCRSYGLLSSIATDLGNTVLFPALATGATLHLFSKNAINDADALHHYFEQHAVDCIKIVPSHWKALSDQDRLLLPGKLLVFGGEALEAAVIDSIRASGSTCTVVNHYGPTETTVGKLLHVVSRERIYDSVIPVGKPFSNTRIYVLNDAGQRCPVGVPGELYIGGEGVAAGYLNNADLTAGRFINDPYFPSDGVRLYRTGDLVKYLPDGNIVFMGRVDDQVKIRGYRVEPGEISRVLSSCEGVSQGVVIAREDKTGSKRLIGYVIAADFDRDSILEYLRSRLPEYMVPAALIPLEHFPLLPNGKIDRKGLPDPEIVVTPEKALPVTALEKTLAAIWSNLLEIEDIGVHDDFFALGGHSLLAIRVISAIRKQLGLVISIGDVFDFPTIASLAAQLLQQTAPAATPELQRIERPAHIPLSYSQERLWFIDQLEGSLTYHIPTVLRLKGHLNREALAAAFQAIVNRHEVLRTVIAEEDGVAYQQVLEKDQWQLQITDESLYRENEAVLQQYLQQLINMPFDLCSAHMLRVHLVVAGPAEHILLVVLHHIASDGWSTGIMVRELAELYRAFSAGHAPVLPALDIQYADYAIWQRNYLSGAVMDEKISYWKNKLTNVPALNLPTDFPRPPVQSTKGAISTFYLDRELTAALQALSREEGVTLFMTLLATFKVLLYRYTGQQDICVGTSIAGRTRQEIEGLIGFFINTLALRSDLGNNISFTALLQQIKQTTLGAYEHQEVPFEKVVETVVKDRDVSRTPLFQVAFALQSIPDIPELQLGDIVLDKDRFVYTTAKFDLTFTVQETAEGMTVFIEYVTDLFTPATISRMAGHYEQLLRAVTANRQQPAGQLRMLLPEEEQQLLFTFNDNKADYPQDKTIIDLFEAHVLQTPEAPVLIWKNAVLTYRELDEQSSRLAHYLATQGVTAEMLVPVCMERSFDMVIAILGILKAGAAYVPVDPDYPQQRMEFMLTDTGAVLLLTDKASLSRLPQLPGIRIIVMEDIHEMLRSYVVATPVVKPLPEHLAYVIYTSGSTGKPKGVMIEHRGVVNLAQGHAVALRISAATRTLQFASFGFDASCYEIFNTILNGGLIVLPQQEDLLSSEKFAALVSAQAVTMVVLPPSYLHMVRDVLGPVKTVLSVGEALNREDAAYVKAEGRRLLNAYGPTENTVCTTMTDHPLRDHGVTVIGGPITNVQVYILSPDLALCPVGVAGEICAGGAGLSRGYLNRSALTAERFITNPFSTAWGGRLYRTGDLGRWLPDGTIEYLGRIDDQVKIRGYRIELGEIEKVLQDCGLVAQAVVLAKEGAQGDKAVKRLVAYIVPQGSFDREGILTYLRQQLPEYMVPSVLIAMAVFPLTPSGKYDRKALPEPEGNADGQEYVAPRTATEYAVAAIWQDLLQVPQVGIYDNFFGLGGHSLMAMRLMSALRNKLHVELSMKILFLHPTLVAFAAQVAAGNRKALLPAIEATVRPDNIPLSYSQERLWFIDQLEGSVHYHIPTVLRLKGTLNTAALTQALAAVVNRHEVLRTVFEEQEGNIYQVVMDKDGWQLEIRQHSGEAGLEEEIRTLVNQPFDLARDYMLRAHLLVLDVTEYILVLTVHHIAADGWSAGIIIRELMAGYHAALEHSVATLPALDIQYADYAIWERTYLSGAVLEQQLQYWKNKLADTAILNLPLDHARPAIQSTRGGLRSFLFDQQLLAKLQSLSKQEGVTLYMTLLSAFKVLLYRYSNQHDICVGTSIASRTRQETEGLVGFFINTLALRSTLEGNPSFTTLLQQVKETTLSAYEHQEVPFEKVVEQVVTERDVSRTPLFQVMFEMQNTPDTPELQLGEVTLLPEGNVVHHAKFDLNLSLQEVPDGLQLTAGYCADLFEDATIDRMIGHYEQLLKALAERPSQKIDHLPLLTTKEEDQLLHGFNHKTVAYPHTETLVTLFARQAKATPAATALILGDAIMSYEELDQRSTLLGQFLVAHGVIADTLVPVCVTRSMEMVIALLGIMKAGGAYVPVDPEYPEERIRYMLQDSSAKLVVADSYGKEKLPALPGVDIITTDTYQRTFSDATSMQTVTPAPHDLSYVIYTSGSTGLPKGVMVEHGGMLNHLFAKINDLQISDKSMVAFNAAYTFDISVWQIFAALLCGGTTIIYPEEVILHPAAMMEAVDRQQVTILELVPSYLAAVLDENIPVNLSGLKYLMVTGEAISRHTLEQWFSRYKHIPVVNAYGPTEASDDICHYIMHNVPGYTNVPLGAPVQNLHIYILDKEKQLCPVGVPGEICVSGVGVTRGYLNRPDLTARQFINDPFVASRGRMYRTGDLGRWLPDGNVEYLGRMDEQVKIRGYRIELGEIESVLLQSGRITETVVIAHAGMNHIKRLVAYIVPKGTFDKTAILNYLKEKLPEYMVPSLLVELDRIPLTANGKTDRKALPDPGENAQLLNEYVAPRNETEQALVVIWCELLGLERIGVHDNFFELGGHSLQVMRLIAMIRKTLQVKVSVRDFFMLATIESLAKYIRVNQSQATIAAEDLQTIRL